MGHKMYNMRNIGIVKKIELTRLDNLLSIPKGTTIVMADVTMAAGSSFAEIAFEKGSASFTEMEDRTVAGLLYTKNISFSVTKNNDANLSALDTWKNGKLAARVTDTNGEVYLVYPARMIKKRNIPSDVTDPNRIDVTLNGKSMYTAPFVTL